MDFNNWFSVGGMTTDTSRHRLKRTKRLGGVYTIEGIDEKT